MFFVVFEVYGVSRVDLDVLLLVWTKFTSSTLFSSLSSIKIPWETSQERLIDGSTDSSSVEWFDYHNSHCYLLMKWTF